MGDSGWVERGGVEKGERGRVRGWERGKERERDGRVEYFKEAGRIFGVRERDEKRREEGSSREGRRRRWGERAWEGRRERSSREGDRGRGRGERGGNSWERKGKGREEGPERERESLGLSRSADRCEGKCHISAPLAPRSIRTNPSLSHLTKIKKHSQHTK